MVRQRDSGQIFAMKMLHKWEMLKRAEVSLESGETGALNTGEGGGREGAGVQGVLAKRWRGCPTGRGSTPNSCRLPHPFLTRNLPWKQVELFPLSL